MKRWKGEKMNRAKKRQPVPTLRRQLFLSSIAIALICGLCSIYIIDFSEQQIKAAYSSRTVELLASDGQALNRKMKDMQAHVLTLLSNSEYSKIKTQLSNQSKGNNEAERISFFSEFFSDWTKRDPYIKQVFAVTPEGMYFSLTNETLRKKNDFRENVEKLLNQIQQPSMIYWGRSMENVFYQQSGRVIPVVVTDRSLSVGKEIYIVILLDEKYIFEDLSLGKIMGDKLIVDGNGEMVSYVEDPFIQRILQNPEIREMVVARPKELQKIKVEHTRLYTICCDVGGNMNWKLLVFATEQDLFGSLTSAKIILLIVTGAMLLVSFFCSIGISHGLTKPLYELRDAMKMAVKTNFTSHFLYHKNDVIGDLSESYNAMLDEINQLISQLEEEKNKARIHQLLKRRAELKALQAQINPHFLYNTLDTINWMAIEAGADDISEMVVSLAELFRLGLKRGNELSELNDEIEHVRHYLTIQKMRYADKFEYAIDDVGETGEKYFCIRLLLQPLVENSIYHSIKQSRKKCRIQVHVIEREKDLVLQVVDDGAGFEPGKMDEINEKLKRHVVVDKSGYGIFNVNERINLYFGPEYGLQYRAEGDRTVAEITLPKVSETEAGVYDEYSHRG